MSSKKMLKSIRLEHNDVKYFWVKNAGTLDPVGVDLS